MGRLSRSSNMAVGERVFPQHPSTPATDEDKIRWKGFCEIESEPVSSIDLQND